MSGGHDSELTPEPERDQAPDVAPSDTVVGGGGSGVQMVQTLVAGTNTPPDPQRVLAIIDSHRSERDAIVRVLTTRLGSSWVRQMIDQAQPATTTDAMPPNPDLVERVRNQPDGFHLDRPDIMLADSHTPRVDPATRPAPQSNTNYKANYKLLDATDTLDHYTATDATKEAPILNAVRHSNNRFEPAWMLALQKHLGVRETGAFNTDTLRALRKGDPSITVKDLTEDTGVLAKMLPGGGAPFRAIGEGFGASGAGSTAQVQDPNDLAHAGARCLGYPNYGALYGALKPEQTFLGQPIRGRVHPHLAARLKLAEDWINQRHKNAKPSDVGWKGDAVSSYHDSVSEINLNDGGTNGPHLHAYGIAIDFDPDLNPWVFDKYEQDPASAQEADPDKRAAHRKAINDNNWWVEMFERQFALSARIYGGEAITADKMATWSETMSSEELWARINQASTSFKYYLELGEFGSDTEIDDIFVNKLHLPNAADMKRELRGLAKPGASPKRFFKDFMGRDKADSITTHSEELIVALRDVAGLAWGGTEMSHPVNGDFMHFDCRSDTLGKHLFDFAMANRKT